MSIDNSISCASCHRQEFAFSDTLVASAGMLGGKTSRHSMLLVNARFADEMRFFWNERAANLPQQTTHPIQEHMEMGFSGQGGRPGIAALISKLQAIDYYKELLQLSYGDANLSESRLQECLSQFIFYIQSFDSCFDAGRASAPNDGAPFTKFTPQENMGKKLFLAPRVFNGSGQRTGGGLGCQGCHRAPEFDINPLSLNNGITGPLAGPGREFDITRSPALRDLVRGSDKRLNGPLMHTGNVSGLRGAVDHYNSITATPAQNPNLDPRVRPNGMGQQLNMTEDEKRAIVAFLETLGSNNMYTYKKWSNPFR